MELLPATLLERHPGWPRQGAEQSGAVMNPSQLVPLVAGDV